MKKSDLSFTPATAPLTEPVTKFGGQPVWLEQSQWPLSRSTGNPMRFIGQIALDPELFGNLPARMAYLFMTDEDDYVDGTWDPESGENAVILQPGGTCLVATRELADGPTLYRMVPTEGKNRRHPEPCEFAVTLEPGEDPEDSQDLEVDDDGEALEAVKIGGCPAFLQGDETPQGEWMLLLQMDSASVPFDINFGDAGVGYAFLSKDGTQARFLWQCG